jgi:hypothetical protein
MPEPLVTDLHTASARFVHWLDQRVLQAGRGDTIHASDVEPAGRFWLGRLATEEEVKAAPWGDRTERMQPCAIGIRLRPHGTHPWRIRVTATACAWIRRATNDWRKTRLHRGTVEVVVHADLPEPQRHPLEELQRALAQDLGVDVLRAVVRTEVERDRDGIAELTVQLVNASPRAHPQLRDTSLYQVTMTVEGVDTRPFLLEALPDSFRYDRKVPAYGINCAVQVLDGGGFRTADTVVVERYRPRYWNVAAPCPDLRFDVLATDPLPALWQLVRAHREWGEWMWSERARDHRAERDLWSEAMRVEADQAAQGFAVEAARLSRGLELLEQDPLLLRAFQLMNRAMTHAAAGQYRDWRPFQLGFLLAALPALMETDIEAGIAEILWFATGGGKTETYLGLLVMAAFHDRLTGKTTGVTAWSRFPLRMLSLQQTQRFADAFAGAELVRRHGGIPGEPFAVGFLVGREGTPNQIDIDAKEGAPDPDDDTMPARYQVLLYCPFCHADVAMHFDRRSWRLQHRCTSTACPWPEPALPFHIVDHEIFRFLPTVVVGTLDKAASISRQAAMRGLLGPPHGRCSEPGHGYTYAARTDRPNGCLVPGCRGRQTRLPMDPTRYAPRFRLQDELHLLRDSLGAVDSHYESLLDHLERELGGSRAKVVASSATLSGHERQAQVLYQRTARVFPMQGPSAGESFWTADAEQLLRRFVAVAPRGVTLEFAADRTLTELQRAVRLLLDTPEPTCHTLGIDPALAGRLLSLYGTDVVYGNTIRDLDASIRSLDTQVPVEPLITAPLTGHTPFEQVRTTLARLQQPEEQFGKRIHVIAASAMMSHGVDIDRLNVMVMLGIPLATAEFIQTTARIGRRWPGLVIVLHRMARERDASVFRSFTQFVHHGDRFVEPIPITRRSRRVLARTVAGLELARITHLYEPRSGQALSTVSRLRAYFQQVGVTADGELDALTTLLGLDGPLDERLREDIEDWLGQFFRNLTDPAGTFRFPSDLCPLGPPMLSLRDVEEQAPIRG